MRRRSVVVVLVCLFCLSAVSAAFAEGWPGFRGPNFDGTIKADLFEDRPPALTVAWNRTLGSGYSAIAVDELRVVTMFADGDGDFLGAYDPESGDELWRYRIGDTYPGHDGSHDGPISTPRIAGERVYGLGPWGHLFAVDAGSGRAVWTVHLVDDLGAEKPYYGFTTSPVLSDGVLVVEIGAPEGKTIAGLDADSGKVLWTAGDDTISYQSPVLVEIGGQRQVLAVGQTQLYGIEPASGEVLWSYQHDGDDAGMGGETIVPLLAGEGRVFLMNEFESSVMLGVTKKGAEYQIEELWSTTAIKRSYVTPVHHDGHLYGMSNRIFTCIDAATGETRWRSREPGDGFPTIVGDKLIMITKPGSLHVAHASPAGYKELARLDLFDDHSWSEVAYAGGHLYARSMARLARIDPDAGDDSAAGAASWIEATGFGRFLAEVEQAESKTAVIDAFLERQSAFPIIEETGAVHFVYRGEAEDVGIVGDMIGYRREDPMIRVDGTDLFHYSTRLEPDAAVAYGFIPEYGEALPDPRNPNRDASGLFGDVSWFAMPAWQAPDHFDDRGAARAGRLDGVEWESAVREGQQRTATVYLPPGYAESDRRYPVIYVHNGNAALETGRTKGALDRSIGTAVDPLIAVFVTADQEDLDEDLDWESYAEMIVKELIPLIDGKYRTLDERLERASVGSGREAANVAMFLAFEHPELFGRVAGQSSTLAPENLDTLHGADETPMVIYLEWGRYHRRSPHEAWSDVDDNRQMWTALREAGYRPAGGETAEGYAWAFWRAHSDEMLRALFPLRE